jgi:hypothetical protein
MALNSLVPSTAMSMAPPSRYLMLSSVFEGFGAWSDAIFEFVDLAKQLNRTFVEPCVRNGCIEPCRYGFVHSPPSTKEVVDAFERTGHDHLNLPYINFPCSRLNHEYPDEESKKLVGESYPLSAYLDMASLREYYPHIISYDQWFEQSILPQKDLVKGVNGRILLPTSYCGDMHISWCIQYRGPYREIGDFAFIEELNGRPDDLEKQMTILRADSSETIFYHSYYRYYFHKPNTFKTVPFHPAHYLAAFQFKRDLFENDNLAVFQWRTEHVSNLVLPKCATVLSTALSGLKLKRGKAGFSAVLVSDLPSPSNRRKLWHTYENGDDDVRKHTISIMLDAGFAKYDYYHNTTDNGVLMIRDFILTQIADTYVTCAGDFVEKCRGCFRSSSNFVQRITQARELAKKESILDWFQLIPGARMNQSMSL